MTLAALIFDVDGTLADTEEVHRRAFNEAFAQHGLDWSWSRPQYAELLKITGGRERLGVFIDSLGLAAGARRSLRDRIADLHRAKTAQYGAHIGAGAVALREGIERLLDEAAAAGIALAIASTTTLANIEALLHATLGAQGMRRFAVIGAGEQVPRKKPSPDIYDWVLRELGRAPHECAALEDSANGLAAAKAAGLCTVVTPSYWTRGEDFAAADLVLPSLGSPQRPLPARVAQLLGNDLLTIRGIEALLARAQEPRPQNPERRAVGGR